MTGICALRPSRVAASTAKPLSQAVPNSNHCIRVGTASRLILTVWRPGPDGVFVSIYTIGPDPRHFASSRAAIEERNMRGNTGAEGWLKGNLRSCRGASGRGFHHFAGRPCLFPRDCTHASRYVRVLSQG